MKKTPDVVYKIPGEQPVVANTLETVRQDLELIFQSASPAEALRYDNTALQNEARFDVQKALNTEQARMIAEAAAFGHGLKDRRLAATR